MTSGDGRHGVPHGMDRGIYCGLATEARRQGARVRVTPRDLARLVRPDWIRDEVAERLLRVAYSISEIPRHDAACPCGCRFMPRRAMVAEWVEYRDGVFTIELSRAFMHEVEHGAPVALSAVQRLLPACAAFDRYLWMVQRAQRGEQTPAPMFGKGGLRDLMAIARSEARARQIMRHWIEVIREVWPECPYRLNSSGNAVICIGDPARALAAHLEAADDLEDASALISMSGMRTLRARPDSPVTAGEATRDSAPDVDSGAGDAPPPVLAAVRAPDRAPCLANPGAQSAALMEALSQVREQLSQSLDALQALIAPDHNAPDTAEDTRDTTDVDPAASVASVNR